MQLFYKKIFIISKTISLCLEEFIVLYDRWYDRNCSVGFKVIILLVFDSYQWPLSSPENFTHHWNEIHNLERVKGWVGLAKPENCDYPEEPQHEITNHRVVVEPGWIIHFFSQSVGFWILRPQKSPIHVDIPTVGVKRRDEMNRDVDPKRIIIVIFHIPETSEWHTQVREIFSSIDQVKLLLWIPILT